MKIIEFDTTKISTLLDIIISENEIEFCFSEMSPIILPIPYRDYYIEETGTIEVMIDKHPVQFEFISSKRDRQIFVKMATETDNYSIRIVGL